MGLLRKKKPLPRKKLRKKLPQKQKLKKKQEKKLLQKLHTEVVHIKLAAIFQRANMFYLQLVVVDIFH